MKIDPVSRRKNRQLGIRGENIAAKLLESSGMTILARNYRCKAGELDLVALDGNEIVFAEVKTLRYRKNAAPFMNLSARQRRRNRNAAVFYFRMLGSPPLTGRFDLIEVICRGPFLHSLKRTEDYLPPLPPGGRFQNVPRAHTHQKRVISLSGMQKS